MGQPAARQRSLQGRRQLSGGKNFSRSCLFFEKMKCSGKNVSRRTAAADSSPSSFCPKFRLKSPNFIYKSSKIGQNLSQKSHLAHLGLVEKDRTCRKYPSNMPKMSQNIPKMCQNIVNFQSKFRTVRRAATSTPDRRKSFSKIARFPFSS